MTTSEMFVSVIIPAYNAEHYIKDAIRSVLSQTYKDYEILVVDDGSTDKTLDVLSKFNSSVRIYTKDNGGPASARNYGIKRSSGKFIAFLDADDLWTKDKLSTQVNYMITNKKIGFSYSDAIAFSVSKEGKKVIKREFVCDLEGSVYKDLFWSNFIITSTVMVRRSCFNKVGMFDVSKNLIGSEDFDMWLRLSRIFSGWGS